MLTKQLMSGANAAVNQVSPGEMKGDLSTFSVQFVFSSATSAGAVTLECSNDNVNWITVDGSSVTIAAGEAAMINVSNGGYAWVRAVWTPTAGTGTITAPLVVLQPANRS
jgi:hypothetical protein